MRLRARAEFVGARRRGARRSGPRLIVYAAPNGLAHARLGLTTSRKVGGAVRRNRWRRLLREIFRRNKAAFADGHDFVVIVRAGCAPGSYDEVAEELVGLARAAERAVGRRLRKGSG